MTEQRAAVVGAGPGGLAAGMLLASQGYEVTVYEKQPFVGGRTSRVQLGDYRFDCGPTFLMMPYLLEELFASAGRSVHDYVKLVELDTLYRLRFGEMDFEPVREPDRMVERIEALFPGNGKGYLRFMKEEEEKFRRVGPLLQRPFARLTDYLTSPVFAALSRLHALDTVHGRLSRYFTDERLKLAFTFQAKYLGMSPWACPGTFTILSYLEHAYGLYHPIGGVNRICEAMAEVIKEYGGRVLTSSPVERVLLEKGRAVGLRLAGGEEVQASHVILNADFGTAMTSLFEPGQLKRYTPRKLEAKKYSCSTYMLYLGVNRRVELPHHTIMFAEDYRANVRDITETLVLSEDASVYVCNPGVTDPTLAPEGKSALYVLMPVPNLSGGIDWEKEKTLVRDAIIRRLEREPELAGLSACIEEERITTPLDWQDDYGVYRGATFNLAHSLDQMMHLRPHNRFQEAANCWLVGGGTHPGSGLPTIIESARISTRLLMEQDARAGVSPFAPKSNVRQVPAKEAVLWK
ncbi:phytoene desaturase family protein [Paenibacillus aurantius]|uniref:Phytoene desaturase family protein n=1 Tax=Paenibacillus aurantius TaxID=2918900 RepID=A0AA96LBE2_9BACL|nr:phytoene desaturase family protein [Paenibacillus aurantius]WNQ10024.1 phytoene desaturase family protein [Paenibacillus aurantius]